MQPVWDRLQTMPKPILSIFSPELPKADRTAPHRTAFTALMKHLAHVDPDHRVIMVQEVTTKPACCMTAGTARPPTDRFLVPMMNDLAAPRIALVGPSTVTGRPGAAIHLRARTSDPDGNRVSIRWWWSWDEVGTYAGKLALDKTSEPGTSFRIPTGAKPGDQLQILGEATDDAALPLTPYVKLVIHVEQAQAGR